MLTVRTRLGQSKIAGIGLFAAEPVPAGLVVWEFNPLIDLLLSEHELRSLSEPSRTQLLNYAYFDESHRKFLLCGDDARFFNHCGSPNCDEREATTTRALKAIAVGDELTVNYREFYGGLETAPFHWLN